MNKRLDVDHQPSQPTSSSAESPASRWVTACLCWFLASPIFVFAFDALDQAAWVSGDVLTMLLAVVAGSQMLAFFGAVIGGLRVVGAHGRRRWLTSAVAIVVLLIYLLMLMSRAHM